MVDLLKQWTYDTASDTHVCNDITQFVTYTPMKDTLRVGNTECEVEGKGLVYLTFGNTTFDLYETQYTLGFYLNIVSASRALKAGVYHNQRLNRLEQKDGTPICPISYDIGIALIQRNVKDQTLFQRQSNTFQATQKPHFQAESEAEVKVHQNQGNKENSFVQENKEKSLVLLSSLKPLI
jgi:hypothetical protein